MHRRQLNFSRHGQIVYQADVHNLALICKYLKCICMQVRFCKNYIPSKGIMQIIARKM